MPRTSSSGVPAFVAFLNGLPSDVTVPSIGAKPITDFFQGSFGSGKALQLSAAQIAVEFQSQSETDYLLVHGVNMSLPLSSLNGDISLANATGTVTSADVYSGGTFSSGAVTGGTEVGTLTFSSSQYQLSAGGDSVTLTGTNLPTDLGVVDSIIADSYAGPALTISGLTVVDGSLTVSISLSATALSVAVGDYKITFAGSFPTTLTATQINDLVSGIDPGVSATVTGATVTDTATNSVVETATTSVAGGLSVNALGFTAHGVADSVEALLNTIAGVGVTGDLLGDKAAQYLIENTAGAVVVGDLSSDSTVYTQVGVLGPEWTIHGKGDFLGEGHDQFIMENTNGAIVLGDVGTNKTASYAQIGSVGAQWIFDGVGDFLGEGHDQFILENTKGAVVLGDVGAGGQATFTRVGALGPEWKFVGAGDFLGLGHDQFLIENTNGAVVVGDVEGGAATYTQIGALGPEWKFVGVGDIDNNGHAQFLIENTAGAVVVGDVEGGVASYTKVAALGAQWQFVGMGQYYGAGGGATALIENSAGALVEGFIQGDQTSFYKVSALGSEWKFHG